MNNTYRKKAREQLKNCVPARFSTEAIVITLTGGRIGQNDWSLECDKIIDLLDDDADYERGYNDGLKSNTRVPERTLNPCPWCGRDMDRRSEADKDNEGHGWYRDDSDYIQNLIRSNEFLRVKERTCKQEERGWGTEGDHARVWLTCGHDCMVPTVQDLPNYCPECGAKVIQ